MTDTPEPFDLTSHNIPADKSAELLRLFPEIQSEGGKIDFERLKLALGDLAAARTAYERDVLFPLAAQRIEIDLDDGVKVNYAKFGNALAKIVGL